MSQTTKRLLIVMRRPPYGDSSAKDSLDLALASAVFDQEVTLLFMGDGVFQLLQSQAPDAIHQKSLAATLGALALYGIEKCYASREALEQRGLQESQLVVPCQLLDNHELTALFEQQDALFNF